MDTNQIVGKNRSHQVQVRRLLSGWNQSRQQLVVYHFHRFRVHSVLQNKAKERAYGKFHRFRTVSRTKSRLSALLEFVLVHAQNN